MSGAAYRPLTDVWILARTKSHYYGSYPEGFLWRAKVLPLLKRLSCEDPETGGIHCCWAAELAARTAEVLAGRPDPGPIGAWETMSNEKEDEA